MDHSMLTCSCRRSHHSLNQTISCGGWGDGQSKRTCEIYTPGSGWSKENYLLARPTVEHQSWGIPIRKPNFKPHPDFPGQILLLLNGNEEKLVIPKESFKKRIKIMQFFLPFFRKLLAMIVLFIKASFKNKTIDIAKHWDYLKHYTR